MPRATKDEAEKTALRIREVATAHFREHGYTDASLIAIAQEAGVTRGAIYHHFPSKQALYEAVVGELHATVLAGIEFAVADIADPWEQLVRGCEAFIETAIDPTVRQILLVEAPALLGWNAWREMDDRTSHASLMDVLIQLEAQEVVRPGSAEATARLLSGALNEAVLWIAQHDDTSAAKAEIGNVFARMLEAIRS